MQFQSTTAVANNGVKCLVYGRSGVGKTRLAATCPAPVILSAEAGLLSLRGVEIPFAQISTLDQLRSMLDYFANARDNWSFRTIILDSVSEIAEVVLKNAKAQTKDPRKAYGTLIDEMIPIVRAFRDLPYRNIVVIAKEEWSKDETNGAMIYGPNLPGSKLGPDLPYYFDEVFRYIQVTDPTTKQSSRWLQTTADYQTVAKDRSGALDAFEAPHMGAIFTKITGVA